MWSCLPFTDEFSALTTVVTQLPGDYGSPIWSAVDRAVTTLAAETGRRVILLMSDGVDEVPRLSPQELRWILSGGRREGCSFVEPMRVSLKDVIRRAEHEGVMVYSITVDPRSYEGGAGASNMARLSGDTGGGFRLLSDTSYLRSAFTSIADELRMQYLLGFVPSYTDGKRHEIKVKLKTLDATVRAREAYVAAKR
jgi:VWFA-related protein